MSNSKPTSVVSFAEVLVRLHKGRMPYSKLCILLAYMQRECLLRTKLLLFDGNVYASDTGFNIPAIWALAPTELRSRPASWIVTSADFADIDFPRSRDIDIIVRGSSRLWTMLSTKELINIAADSLRFLKICPKLGLVLEWIHLPKDSLEVLEALEMEESLNLLEAHNSTARVYQ